MLKKINAVSLWACLMWECELDRWGRKQGMMKSTDDFLLGEKKLKENLKKKGKRKPFTNFLAHSVFIKPGAGNSF